MFFFLSTQGPIWMFRSLGVWPCNLVIIYLYLLYFVAWFSLYIHQTNQVAMRCLLLLLSFPIPTTFMYFMRSQNTAGLILSTLISSSPDFLINVSGHLVSRLWITLQALLWVSFQGPRQRHVYPRVSGLELQISLLFSACTFLWEEANPSPGTL